jgi:hypothetical protein
VQDQLEIPPRRGIPEHYRGQRLAIDRHCLRGPTTVPGKHTWSESTANLVLYLMIIQEFVAHAIGVDHHGPSPFE